MKIKVIIRNGVVESALSDKGENIDLEVVDIDDDFEQLEQYRKDEREGRIIRLPCKVGDMVYYKRGRDILGDTVDRISIDEADNQVILNAHKTFSFCDFGRKVFSSYEEAAAKLS